MLYANLRGRACADYFASIMSEVSTTNTMIVTSLYAPSLFPSHQKCVFPYLFRVQFK